MVASIQMTQVMESNVLQGIYSSKSIRDKKKTSKDRTRKKIFTAPKHCLRHTTISMKRAPVSTVSSSDLDPRPDHPLVRDTDPDPCIIKQN